MTSPAQMYHSNAQPSSCFCKKMLHRPICTTIQFGQLL